MAATTALSTDPIVMARDGNNDLIVPIRFASGLDAVLILVRCAWLLWRGEYYLNIDVGTLWLAPLDGSVPDRDAIFGEPYDAAKLARALRTEALVCTAVIDVTDFVSAFNAETRNVTVNATVVAQFADQVVSGPLEVSLSV